MDWAGWLAWALDAGGPLVERVFRWSVGWLDGRLGLAQTVETILGETVLVVGSGLGLLGAARFESDPSGTAGSTDATTDSSAEETPAEETSALERERQISAGIIDALPGLFVLVTAEGTILRCNEAFETRVIGDRRAALGRPITLADLFGASQNDRLSTLCERAVDEGAADGLVSLPGDTDTDPPHQWSVRRMTVDGEVFLALTATRFAERAHSRGAIEEHKEQYRFVVDNVADVLTRHAPDTTCRFATPSVEQLLGYTPDEMVGRPCIELLHPDDRPQTWDNIHRALDGEVVKRRARLQHKDGHYVWVEMTSRLWVDPETGEPGDIVVSTRNVTDRVLAEQAMQKSEERLRQVAENIDGVFWLRTEEEYLYVSPAYERIWGRPVEDLYENPASYLDAIHPDDRERVVEVLNSDWEGEVALEYRIVQPDGTVRWVHSMAGRVPVEGRPDRYAGYAVDVTPKKAQEEALRQSEERWRRLVETHMEPILISVEGVIRYINPSGAQLLGADVPEDIIGRPVHQFVADSHQDEIDKRLERIEAGKPTEPFEHRMERLDGEVRVVESYSVPIQYHGQPAAQTVVRDITDWREAQSRLEYRVMLENLIVDLSTRFIDMEAGVTDARIEEALGRVGPFVGADRSYVFLFDNEADTLSYTHEWCGPGVEPQKDMIQAVPKARFPWLLRQLQTQQAVHVPDVAGLPPDAAEEQDVLMAQNVQSLVLVPMTDGRNLIGFVGFDAVKQQRAWQSETIMLLRVLGDAFANALARKEAEQALREREDQYRTVVENVRDVVFQTDMEGRWTFLNPAWETLTGYAVDDTLGNPFLAYLEGPELEELRNGLRHDTIDAFRSEVKLRTRDDSVRWMTLFAQPLREEGGRATGLVGTLHDVTERKRMEQQTREALRRERELNRLKSSVVSMVSHEFRTPLSTIRSSAEMIDEFFDQWSAEKRAKHIERIHRQIDRMSRLLGDVITTSKLDAQHEDPSLAPIGLRRFHREVADEVRAHHGTDRTVDVTMTDVPDEVTADPDLLHHIFSNLLSNALKYSPEDTSVAVQWRVDDGRLHLRVEDEGMGIPDAEQEHLFRAFFRASNAKSADGSGLGMTIVQRAVDVYGGTLSVDSTEGEGTTFEVTLPTTAADG